MASDTADTATKDADPKVLDLEVKDAQIIFNSVWASLEDEFGEEQLRFPKEIFCR
jgi:adenylate kinase